MTELPLVREEVMALCQILEDYTRSKPRDVVAKRIHRLILGEVSALMAARPEKIERVFNLNEAAKYLGINKLSLRRKLDRGEIAYALVNPEIERSQLMIRKRDLDGIFQKKATE